MKCSRTFYALTIAGMLMLATGLSTMVSANLGTSTPSKIAQLAFVETAHAEDAPAPVVAAPQAEAPAVDEAPPVSDGDFFTTALKAIGDILGAIKQEGSTQVAIVLSCLLILAQLAIQFTKTSLFGKVFSKVGGPGKLLIVSICTVVTTFVPLVIAGVPWGQALTSGAVLTAIMVAGHQIYLQWLGGQEAKKS